MSLPDQWEVALRPAPARVWARPHRAGPGCVTWHLGESPGDGAVMVPLPPRAMLTRESGERWP